MAQRGLKRGDFNPGGFKKGDDPRRYTRKNMLVPGTTQTLPELCRLRTLEALDVIVRIVKDKNAPVDVRRKAADSLLDRGWGKAEQAIRVEDNTTERDLKSMSTTELMALLMAKQDEERTLEGELEEGEGGGNGTGADQGCTKKVPPGSVQKEGGD